MTEELYKKSADGREEKMQSKPPEVANSSKSPALDAVGAKRKTLEETEVNSNS